MNIMYNMTQFVVVVSDSNEISVVLADKHFIQYVILEFRICYLDILDNDSLFKGIISIMREPLHIHFVILAKVNHKGFLVEKNQRLIKNLSRLQRKIEERMMSLLLLTLQQDIHEIFLQLIYLSYFVVFLTIVGNLISSVIMS